MTDHASLLRQFFSEALPIMERSLEVRDEFSGLQKAVTAKGLDWGQLKALARAVAEDARKEDGTKRVDKIINKANSASAYADMLGLGGAKMNENNFSSEDALRAQDEINQRSTRLMAKRGWIDPVTGEIIESDTTVHVSVGEDSDGARVASSPTPSKETAPVSGDAGETDREATGHMLVASPIHSKPVTAQPVTAGEGPAIDVCQGVTASRADASPTLSECSGGAEAARRAHNPEVVGASPTPVTISDPGPLPPFLKRGDPQCAIDRDARRKVRTSESMDDSKALSAEAMALRLISPEAHAETVRIADEIARKLGAGVIS